MKFQFWGAIAPPICIIPQVLHLVWVASPAPSTNTLESQLSVSTTSLASQMPIMLFCHRDSIWEKGLLWGKRYGGGYGRSTETLAGTIVHELGCQGLMRVEVIASIMWKLLGHTWLGERRCCEWANWQMNSYDRWENRVSWRWGPEVSGRLWWVNI